MDFKPKKNTSAYEEQSTQNNASQNTQEARKVSSEKLLTFADLPTTPDLICFSHLRWDFVFQRPQHLLTRFAKQARVFFWEEPVFEEPINNEFAGSVEVRSRGENICLITPHLPHGLSHEEIQHRQRHLLVKFMQEQQIQNYVSWYYTPMALEFTQSVAGKVTVFDCMDELSAFAGAPPSLLALEKQLLLRSDVVFTGGISLYEAKKDKHHSVYAFPSSIETQHFAKARNQVNEPEDQKNIPHPRMGFFGVIDERMDIQLLGEVAKRRPDWHIVLLGPVVKIDPATLPQAPNLHYLGMKNYQELPAYLSGWDVALLPFALNESTKFISPTKTPEYLAAGRPVVSTPIRDVVRTYGESGMVQIAGNADEFIAAAERALAQGKDKEWLAKVDAYLANHSWDKTHAEMMHLICQKLMK